MRMKKGFEEPAKPFAAPERKHSGHIGPGPKAGPKRAVNVSIDAEVLAVAKQLKINLSQTFEETLRNLTKEERIRRFQEENREAIESYNRFIKKHGIWSEKYRKW